MNKLFFTDILFSNSFRVNKLLLSLKEDIRYLQLPFNLKLTFFNHVLLDSKLRNLKDLFSVKYLINNNEELILKDVSLLTKLSGYCIDMA